MTNPQAGRSDRSGSGKRRQAAPSRHSSLAPCQQSVENPVSRVLSPVENPFGPTVAINDIVPTGCSS
jgi:hypothetical protein